MGSPLGWDSELDVRDAAVSFASCTPKGETREKNHDTKVTRVYFASQKSVNA